MKNKHFILLMSLALLGLWAGCQSRPKPVTSIAPANEEYGLPASEFGILDTRIANSPGSEALMGLDRKELRRGSLSKERNTQSSTDRAPVERISTVGEELWVIYRGQRTDSPPDAEYPGTGLLITHVEEKKVILPLKQTDVRAQVEAYISSVEVTQQYENPYASKIEAVYVFPLPENGAVNEFLMKIGDRRIRGIIRERDEAEKIYAEAKQQGYVASLMTQERPNIFTQSVANIEPGKQIDISIKYYQTLNYDDGWYEFVFPMVVGPRFNPPGHHKGIGAVSRSGFAASGQPTDLHYLKPHETSGHRVSLQLNIDPGVAIEEYECKTHQVEVEKRGVSGNACSAMQVKLNPTDAVPNKDFVFRYRVAGDKLKTGFVTHMDERGQFFTYMLYPPAGMEALERAPLELVFVLDCSGSMSGEPLKQAKSAIEYGLKNLRPGDSFQLINFSNDAGKLSNMPLEATPENIRRGLRHLADLRSEGGTMMIEGIKAALDFPHDPERLRFVCFLTDGYIGNESEILQAIHKRLGDSRIFSFGVGSSVNRFLLDSMAKVGRGAVAYLGLKDSGSAVMEKFFQRISHPAMTDVKINWGDLEVKDVYPKRLPDVFVGRPLIITGKFEQPDSVRPVTIQVKGRSGRAEIKMPLTVSVKTHTDGLDALPSIWARMKIADLLERARYEPSSYIASQVKDVALEYRLLSPYTAFIALDASRKTAGDSGTTVPVAVPVPEGVRYETTVPE